MPMEGWKHVDRHHMTTP
ncbi:unnamed protein product [Tuber melanosporum]|uniref:(Perigord truffle) hypothetical protein n=1 Tax=Tuber melanosporum (strain Mel28) TaxID=656061 RepID=D5G768_TUBMM|nr:unnamed protein product [Tuber melanosporum]